jgi:YfiH family protein
VSSTIPLITPDWPAPANVRAASTTRIGGVSVGRYASLNLGKNTGDDPAAVDENRRRVLGQMHLPALPSWIFQVHGVRVARAPFAPGSDPEADASFATQAGVVCVVQTADCLPVLFCDQAGTVVAAAHAGWRGLSMGVLEATVTALPASPDHLLAWLGPAIGPDAFEVGSEVRAAFLAALPGAGDAVAAAFQSSRNEGRWTCDLYALARLRLRRAGVKRIFGGGLCTHTDASRFYSYRRDGACGRMATLIWMSEAAPLAGARR